MKLKFDFVLHWIWTILFAILILSGLALTGPKLGWILNYDLALADSVHRWAAVLYVLATLIAFVHEIVRVVNNKTQKQAWMLFGPGGYQFFTFVTTLIFIITGAIIWVCMDSEMAVTGFALYIHEKLTYLVLASLIWHIYQKCHALLWPPKPPVKPDKRKTGTLP